MLGHKVYALLGCQGFMRHATHCQIIWFPPTHHNGSNNLCKNGPCVVGWDLGWLPTLFLRIQASLRSVRPRLSTWTRRYFENWTGSGLISRGQSSELVGTELGAALGKFGLRKHGRQGSPCHPVRAPCGARSEMERNDKNAKPWLCWSTTRQTANGAFRALKPHRPSHHPQARGPPTFFQPSLST